MSRTDHHGIRKERPRQSKTAGTAGMMGHGVPTHEISNDGKSDHIEAEIVQNTLNKNMCKTLLTRHVEDQSA